MLRESAVAVLGLAFLKFAAQAEEKLNLENVG